MTSILHFIARLLHLRSKEMRAAGYFMAIGAVCLMDFFPVQVRNLLTK